MTAKLTALFPTLSLGVCGIVRADVLHGARSLIHRRSLAIVLDSMPQVPLPEPLWDEVGDHLATLRIQGLTISLPDAALATLAMYHDVQFWTRDKHFALIQSVLPALRLFQEPP